MISKQAVEDQLKRIGCNFRFWGRSEVNELGRILLDDEIIAQCVNGEYSNGFAMLVATNHRVLLVDKKPLLYLTVEDLRYEMITEFNLSHRMLNATIRVYTANKTLEFTSWNQHRIRLLLEYVQGRVLEMRQQQHMASQFQAAAAAQYAQLNAAYSQSMQNMASAVPVAQSPQPPAAPDADYQPYGQQYDKAEPQPDTGQPPVPAPAAMSTAGRLASRRVALGTYTRSKLPTLPSLRFRGQGDSSQSGQQPQAPPAESGEVFQGEYRPKPNLGQYGAIPYEYEG